MVERKEAKEVSNSHKVFPEYLLPGYNQVGKLQNLATIQHGTRRRLVLLQTLSTGDFDEMAAGFRGWNLRFRQLGGGAFRGELKFLQLGGIQIFRASCNRRI